MLTIQALPAFTDNYIWLLGDPQTRCCAVVDPGAAEPVLDWLAAHPEWTLTDIIVTHHHADHIGGIPALKQATGATVQGPVHPDLAELDRPLQDGDCLQVLGAEFRVIGVPGHTLDHLAYFRDAEEPWLLCGDTLFAAGCGRVFEGTYAQMHASLQRLDTLPAATRIYCAHEYTQANLAFARAVEPDSPALQEFGQKVAALRAENRITLPTSLATERQINPFLRCDQASVMRAAEQHAAQKAASAEQVFAILREWKNSF